MLVSVARLRGLGCVLDKSVFVCDDSASGLDRSHSIIDDAGWRIVRIGDDDCLLRHGCCECNRHEGKDGDDGELHGFCCSPCRILVGCGLLRLCLNIGEVFEYL